MWRRLLAPAPRRRLAPVQASATRLVTGALGFLDAADEDRTRWFGEFRALLDGLEAALQVLVEFEPGARDGPSLEPSLPGYAGPPGSDRCDRAPPPEARKDLDLRFAERLRSSAPAVTRRVSLITAPAAAGALRRALAALGVGCEERDWVPPAGLLEGVEHPRWVEDGAGLHRTWCLARFPGVELEAGWLLKLMPAGLRGSICWHAERVPPGWAIAHLQRHLVNMRASALAGAGVDPELEAALPSARDLQRDLIASREGVFFLSLYLTVMAASRAELEDASRQVETAAGAALCRVHACDFRQLDARLSTLPLGRDRLGRTHLLPTSAAATLFPWFDADVQEPEGLVLGRSRATGLPVMVDPFDAGSRGNANIGILGHSGAGKTYLLSSLAMGAAARGAQVFIIDPEDEYGSLARSLGGVQVNLGLGGGHAINVLEVRAEAGADGGMSVAIADTVDLCTTMCGGLDEAERSAVDAALRATYAVESEPVLADVVDRLDPASRPAAILRRWVQGGLGSIFSRPTNIDLDAPIVVFGLRELRAELVAPVHLLLAGALWTRIKSRDRRRLLVVDELGLLFEDATIRQFVVTLARRIRKYDGSLVFATQNPGDLLSSEAGRVVATNPAIHLFGSLRPGEAAAVQAAFGLSESQRAGLEAARRGDFLFCSGPDRLAIRVQAPPWQADAMKRARDPPATPTVP